MEHNTNQPANIREEHKSRYDEFYGSLSAEEKSILDQAAWDANGTPWEQGLLDFLEKNSDGSEAAEQHMKQYRKNMYGELSKARASGDVDRMKFLEIVMKMPMPLQGNAPEDGRSRVRSQGDTSGSEAARLPDELAGKQKEPEKVKVDYKAELRKVIDDLEYDLRKIIKEMKWQNTDKKWETGFLEYIEKDVVRSGKFGVTKFKDYVKNLKNDYEDTSESTDPENKKIFKAQLKVAEKMLGIYTSEKEKKDTAAANVNDKLKGIWSWENIKFTLRNIRRQIFELVGTKDPFFDYTQMNKGMADMEKKAGVAPSSSAAGKTDSVFDQFLAKKRSGSSGGSAASGSDSEYKKAA